MKILEYLRMTNLTDFLSEFDNPTFKIIGAIIAFVLIVSLWSVLLKANRSGWGILIPVYGYYEVASIGCSMPLLWTILLFVPVVNLISYGVVMFKLGKAFDKSALFILVLVLFPVIGIPVLAFGSSSKYY